MAAQERKRNLRIARRKKKVQRLIEQKEKELDRLNPDDYASTAKSSTGSGVSCTACSRS